MHICGQTIKKQGNSDELAFVYVEIFFSFLLTALVGYVMRSVVSVGRLFSLYLTLISCMCKNHDQSLQRTESHGHRSRLKVSAKTCELHEYLMRHPMSIY